MKKILINGAGGFIGSNLVRHFIASGYKVVASDLERVDLGWARQLGAIVRPSSLTDYDSIHRSLKGVDIVVHAAAIFDLSVDSDTICRVNTEGTRNYCEAAVDQGVKRLIQFSTTGVYGVPDQTWIPESGTKGPRNAYEKSKWESERIAMSYRDRNGLKIAAVRPTLVYGPGSRYGQAMYVTLFSCLRAWGVETMPLPAGGKLTHHVHVDDVCGAVEAIASGDDAVYGAAYNIADGQPIRAEQVMSLLCREVGLQVRLLPEQSNLLVSPLMRWGKPAMSTYLDTLNKQMARTWPRLIERYDLADVLNPNFDPGWLDYLWADHSYSTRALEGIGWRRRRKTFAAGMPATIEWYREQRWIPTKSQLGAEACRRQAARRNRKKR